LFSLWMLIIPCHEAVRSRNRKTTNRMAVTDLFISLSQVKKQSDGGHIVWHWGTQLQWSCFSMSDGE
jgi:hypothetical protein